MTNHMTMGLWTTLLVTAAAGVGGTGLGGLLATLFRRDSGREARLLLSFAAGVMVSVSCFGLLTEAAAPGAMHLVACGVFLGCAVTAGLNALLDHGKPTGGLVLAGLVMAAAIALFIAFGITKVQPGYFAPPDFMTKGFTGILMAGGATFASFERGALAEGHAIMARAMGRALERRDAALCADLPSRLRVHDVRERSLATTLGDVPFRWRRLRGRDGETVIPLADELDLPWGARVSPAAC